MKRNQRKPGKRADRLADAKTKVPPPIWNFLIASYYVPDDPRVLQMDADWRAQKESGESVLEWYARKAVERARGGDPAAAREVLSAFTAIAKSEGAGAVPRVIVDFLVDAFDAITLNDKPAGRALHLQNSKRGPKDPTAAPTRHQSIAATFEVLRRRGLSETQASRRLETHGISARTLSRARSAFPWMDSPEHYTNKRLQSLLLPRDAAKIELILGGVKKR